MKRPLVTVLMPVFNAEKFLNEAIDSILNQTFRDFELVIIDDGSTDRSIEIAKSYSDPRIVFVLNQTNIGISETLNRGIELASCELIARMDADDISYPDRLQKQYDYMTKNPDCALLSTWCKVITEDKKFVRLERYRSNFYYYNLTFECWMYHPTIMFRKTAVQEVGCYSMKYSEDYDLFWKVSRKFKIWNLNEPLVDYRLSSTSLNTVLKRAEYDVANEKNVVRNLRYFMGPEFEVSKPVLECLRHNFQPIIKQNDVDLVFETLHVLHEITDKILRRKNPNRDERSIRRAHYFKQKFILTEISKALPGVKAVQLLIRAQAWVVLYQFGINAFRWRIRNQLRRAIRMFMVW